MGGAPKAITWASLTSLAHAGRNRAMMAVSRSSGLSRFSNGSRTMNIAAKLGLDPINLRYRNMLKRGEHVRPDLRPIDVDMAEAMGLASQAMSRIEAGVPDLHLAKGAALGISDPGILAVASLMLRLKIDGSGLVICNSVEIGQGKSTVFAMSELL